MVTIYLTRHGQTQWNVQKRMQGWLDSPLTINGQNEALALGKSLATIPFKAAYVSSSGRAIDTAKLICKNRQIPLFFKQPLKEIHVGEWQGMTNDEIQSQFPEQYDAYYNAPSDYQSVEGESFQEVLNRVLPTIEEIINRYDEDDAVLIVTHAVVKKLLIAHFKGLSIDEVWAPPFIHGTSLTKLHINATNEMTIQMIGDTSHLSATVID